jgi:hypothetical protein
MELKPEEKEVLKLLLTRPDISRYHLNTIFPDMSRSTKWSLLHRLTKKRFVRKIRFY